MKKQIKPDTDSLLRIPKAKNKLGLKINKIAMPHDDLISAEKPKLELVEKQSEVVSKSVKNEEIFSVGTTSQATSPEKDFTKTPNSVVRVALARRMFRGKSKQIYDYLWSVSRGAINPTRKIRRTFNEIQKGTGIGSRNTVISGIAHLESIKLIIREVAVGESLGNFYEIFTPEELGYDVFLGSTSSTNLTGSTSSTGTTQKVVVPVVPESGTTGTTLPVASKDTYSFSKTFFKDNTDDDDERRATRTHMTRARTFAGLVEKLSAACEKLTGKPVSHREADKWGNLADLLVLELEKSFRRTDSVSSVPAFLTEILRRQFFTQPTAKSAKAKIDTVGKNDAGEYEIKPLDTKGREAALEQLKDFAGDDFLQDFKKWYTEDDWNWLMRQIGNTNQSKNLQKEKP